MRSRTPSPQQGSNEDEDNWGYLDAVVTKIKSDFRQIKRQGPSRAKVDRLQSRLAAEQEIVKGLRLQLALVEEKLATSHERIGSLSIQLE